MFFLLLLCCAEAVFGFSYKLNVNGTEKTFYLVEYAEELFEQFIVDHQKHYESEEVKAERLEIFRNKLKHINNLNLQHKTIYGITKFSDLTPEEFSAHYASCQRPEEFAAQCASVPMRADAGARAGRLDWRERNAVTPVRNQGSCSSCWAFSTIASLESQYAKSGQGMLDLSEQQLVDCEPTNRGCSPQGGGWTTNGGLYVVRSGVMLESSYPYRDSKGQCYFDPNQVVSRASACLQFSSENELQAALEQYGPISIVVDGQPLADYHGGLVTCPPQSTACTHAVLLVGYDTTGSEPYWIVKNSYGAGWGEQGFFRVPLGRQACGVGLCPMTVMQL